MAEVVADSTVKDAQDALGPVPGVKYPIKVQYCGNCSMPLEYCEYYPDQEKCNKWIEKNLPENFAAMGLTKSLTDDTEGEDDAKKRQKRGGKGMVKAKKKEVEVEKHITLSLAPRGKKKSCTVVTGLKTCGIDLKVASKFFGQKFACGASITGDDEIIIQGDFKDNLFDLIPEKWADVDEDWIEDLGTKKRTT